MPDGAGLPGVTASGPTGKLFLTVARIGGDTPLTRLAAAPRSTLSRVGERGNQPTARAMARKSAALRLAPPTSAPSTSAVASRAAALSGFTEPP